MTVVRLAAEFRRTFLSRQVKIQGVFADDESIGPTQCLLNWLHLKQLYPVIGQKKGPLDSRTGTGPCQMVQHSSWMRSRDVDQEVHKKLENNRRAGHAWSSSIENQFPWETMGVKSWFSISLQITKKSLNLLQISTKSSIFLHILDLEWNHPERRKWFLRDD